MLSKVVDSGIASDNVMSFVTGLIGAYEMGLAIIATMELCYVSVASLYTWIWLITVAVMAHAVDYYNVRNHETHKARWGLDDAHFPIIWSATTYGLYTTALQTGMAWIIMGRPTKETTAAFNESRYDETLPGAVDVRLVAGFWIIMAFQVLKATNFWSKMMVARNRHAIPVYEHQMKYAKTNPANDDLRTVAMLRLLIVLVLCVCAAAQNVTSGVCQRCFWNRKWPTMPPRWAASPTESNYVMGDAFIFPLHRRFVGLSTKLGGAWEWDLLFPMDGLRYTGLQASPKNDPTKGITHWGGCQSPLTGCQSGGVIGKYASTTSKFNLIWGGIGDYKTNVGASDIGPAVFNTATINDIYTAALGRGYIMNTEDMRHRRFACVPGGQRESWKTLFSTQACIDFNEPKTPVPVDPPSGTSVYAVMKPWSRAGDQRDELDSPWRPHCNRVYSSSTVCINLWQKTVQTNNYQASYGNPQARPPYTPRYFTWVKGYINATLWCGHVYEKNDGGAIISGGFAFLYQPQERVLCVNGHLYGTFGFCTCNDGWGGLHCDQAVPAEFDPATATVCPDENVYDICSGRGTCRVNPSGVGLYCICKHGWFPSTWGVDAAAVYNFTAMDTEFQDLQDYEDTVNLYASFHSQDCINGNATWSDPTGWMDRYPRLHLCSFFDGPIDHNYKTAGTEPEQIAPVFPYECRDDRATGGYLRGGWWCKPCTAGCSLEGTANCSDTDPEAARLAPTINASGTEVRCVCRRGWTGDACDIRICPISDATNCSHHTATECDAHLGRGTCIAAHSTDGVTEAQLLSDGSYRSKWNGTFGGRCVCNNGYGGIDNTCSQQLCPSNPHTGAMCGSHGSCVPSDCVAESITVNNVTHVQHVVEFCQKQCALTDLPNGCDGSTLTLAEIQAKLPAESTAPDYTGPGFQPQGTLAHAYQALNMAATLLSEGKETTAGTFVQAVHTDVDKWLGVHKPLSASTNTLVYLSQAVCAICHRNCHLQHPDGGLVVVNQTLVGQGYQVNFTSTSTCASGTCVCDEGWGINPATGTCDWRLCASEGGLECSGLVIHSRYTDAGASVCNRDEADPVCECWRAMASDNPGDPANQIDGRYGLTCNNTYAEACDNSDGITCSGFGTCRVPGCRESWETCTPGTNRSAQPVCSCHSETSGPQCQVSVCGGISSTAPCASNSSGVITTTGVCDLRDNECKCKQVGGIMYTGLNCEDPAPNCSAGDGLLCSGHGDCLFIGNIFSCQCDSGYSGSFCQISAPCGGSCNETGGTCVGGVTCDCFEFRSGSDCSDDLCTDTGGVPVGTDHCDCSTSNGTLYPGAHDPSPTAFKGCRKLCPISQIIGENAECGGLAQLTVGGQAFSRCSAPQISALDAGTPTCDCSSSGPNPNAGNEIQTWQSDGQGACEPKCLYCKQSTTTGNCLPDQCTNPPCQYEGTRCNIPRCSNGGYWNGEECECAIPWLHNSSSDCNATDSCAQQNLGNFSVAPDPLVSGAHHCICTYPYGPDTVSTSPSYRLCISACGAYGEADLDTASCVCRAAVTGDYCNETLCAASGIPNTDGSSCICNREMPQWGGTYCNVSQCQNGGTPHTVASMKPGCDCPAGWHGQLCESITRPGSNSRGVHNMATNTFECSPGFSGPYCNISACGPTFPIEPVACGNLSIGQPACVFGSLDYNCYCSQGGLSYNFFEPSGACQPALSEDACGAHGVAGSGGDNGQTLVCHCREPWITGDLCNVDPCGRSGAGPDAHSTVIDLGGGNYECKCLHDPFLYDPSTGCTKRNCTAMAWPNPPVNYGAVTQVDGTTCGCAVSNHVVRHDAPIWADTTSVPKNQQGDRIWCGPDCNPTTTETESHLGCLTCIEGFGGSDCNTQLTSTPSSDSKNRTVTWAIIGVVAVMFIGVFLYGPTKLLHNIKGLCNDDESPQYEEVPQTT